MRQAGFHGDLVSRILSSGEETLRDPAAGVREVELLPALRGELAEHKAGARAPRPDGLVFATSGGGPQTATNVRRRVLAKAVEKADERLAEAESTPLPDSLHAADLRPPDGLGPR